MEYFITITGIQYNYDATKLSIDQTILLKKEPNNQYDTEAIAVFTEDNSKIGYVAKSCHTQAKGTYSSGRIYDKMEETAFAKILFILNHSAIAKVSIE